MSLAEDDPQFREIVNRTMRGSIEALAELFDAYRDRLQRIVRFRLHPALQGRVDVDDVLQDAYLRAVDRIERFVVDASASPFVWLRMIVSQALIDLHRWHLGAQARDAKRDVSMFGGWDSQSTTLALSSRLAADLTTPSEAARRTERSEQLRAAFATLKDLDREILALRHFEGLTNSETATVLEVSEQVASVRYVRALARLKNVLSTNSLFRDSAANVL